MCKDGRQCVKKGQDMHDGIDRGGAGLTLLLPELFKPSDIDLAEQAWLSVPFYVSSLCPILCFDPCPGGQLVSISVFCLF